MGLDLLPGNSCCCVMLLPFWLVVSKSDGQKEMPEKGFSSKAAEDPTLEAFWTWKPLVFFHGIVSRQGGWPSEIAAARNLCLDRGTADGVNRLPLSRLSTFLLFPDRILILCHWICQATLVSWEWYVNPHVLGWRHVTAQWGYQHRSTRFVKCFSLPRLRSAKVASPISTPALMTTAHASRKWMTTGNSDHREFHLHVVTICSRSLAAALIIRC